MERVVERCAGLDVHGKTIVACVLVNKSKKSEKSIQTFDTTTRGLIELLNWLEMHRVKQVAMESSGVYWKPVWNILESGRFELILANAQHIKNLPGRKTDVKDAEWIAQLLSAGLVPKSFVPPVEIRELRELTRYGKKVLQEIQREKNRIQKILEDGNIKLGNCLSDVFGDSGRQIIERLISGEKITKEKLEREILTGRGKGKLKGKVNELLEVLDGKLSKQHIAMLKIEYEYICFRESQYEEVQQLIDKAISKYKEEIELLDSIPGVNKKGAAIILAEIGINMEQFPSEKHLSAWAGMCPGNNESAGKKKRSKSRQGNAHLKSLLCECAWAAKNAKDTRFSMTYYKYLKKMGQKKSIIAIGNLLLRICYNILKSKSKYVEHGTEYLKHSESKREKNYIKYLQSKGYDISKLEEIQE